MVRGRWLPMILLATFAGCAAGGAARTAARGCSSASRSSSGLARSSRGLEGSRHAVPRGARPLSAGRLATAGELGQIGEARRVRRRRPPAWARAARARSIRRSPRCRRLEGTASALAKVPASSGAQLVGKPGARGLASDYARSIGAVGLARQQHVGVLDALDAAQTILDVATAGDGGPDDTDYVGAAGAAAGTGRDARLTLAATALDLRLRQVLDEAQLLSCTARSDSRRCWRTAWRASARCSGPAVVARLAMI